MDPEYIRNPETGRPIKVGGKVHRRIMREERIISKAKAKEERAAPPKKIRRETVFDSDSDEIVLPTKAVKKLPKKEKETKIKSNGKYKYYASSSEEDSSSGWSITDTESDDSTDLEDERHPIIRHPEYSDESDESEESSESD